ncbi:MAG: putative D-3-phosphoglycerate dehydrogenase [Ramlibacter sp.]|nr:putative D-3-phosphoglycerate dehydrogenase [Ramlibacter sp.]
MTTVFVTHPSHRLDQYFGARALAALRGIAEVRLNPEARELATGELVAAAADCDAMIAYRQTPAPRELFEGLPRLAAFLRCAVDIRTIDVAAASRQGVLVTQASPGYVAAVSEWIVGAMVDLARGFSRYAADYHRQGTAVPAMGRQLRGATLGVIGYGQIGADLAGLALALGMQVLVADPQPVAARPGLRQVSLAALLAGSDFVACLAPANAGTENLMDAAAFAAMPRGSFFINASRGELVDEAALLAALERGHLGGCALDVGRAPDQMPSPALARHPLVLATPHIGGLTVPAIEHQALETVEQLGELLRGGIPRGAVNAGDARRLARWHAGSAA